jgi:hypothetical protein
MDLKKLPIGIQTFSELIGNDYLYVDKTRDIFPLISGGSKYLFLSRPRRFGKSLLLSILKEIFCGRKELFAGLWIEDKLEWEKLNHPIIHIDFSKINYETPELLKQGLLSQLHDCADQYQIKSTEIDDYKEGMGVLIRRLAALGKVVVLIDEYDKPIIDFIDNPKIAKANRDILRNYYSIFKAFDEYLRFVMLTGVSKFSRVSVFSGLNNLRDITISEEYASILGYRQHELEFFFKDYITAAATALKQDPQFLLNTIRSWYNGYSWNGRDFVYNPYSILNFFQEKRIQNYWFGSGTPTFLIKLMQQSPKPLPEYEKYECDADVFESFEIERINPVSLLLQTGYLTIKKMYEKSVGRWRFLLDYPNLEVKESFLKHLLADLKQSYPDAVGNTIYQLLDTINKNDPDEFISILKSIFASIPYNIFMGKQEAYYHTIIYLVFGLLGTHIQAEQQTNQGRIDVVLHSNQFVYIMEFKMGKAKEALAQIQDKGYGEKYKTHNKTLIFMGIGFDAKKRNIGDWLMVQG